MGRRAASKSRGFASGYRLVLLATIVLASFTAIGVRLVHLHVIDRDKLVSYVDRARRSIIIEQARRGDIYDARGDILATSRSEVTLAIDPWSLVEWLDYEKNELRRETLRVSEQQKRARLAQLLQMSAQDVERLYEPRMRSVPIEEDTRDGTPDGLIRDRWVKLREGVGESLFTEILNDPPRGLTSSRSYRRTYPRDQLAAHLIGYVNKEETAAAGVESFADFYLRGQDGWRESERDGLRRELAQFRSREVPATDGYSITLSIDSAIQHLIEVELQRIAENYQPEKATIIVSDPHSGFILGLANYPTFNLNQYSTAPLEHQKNTAITDLIEPGSTFKIIPAAGVVEAGLANANTLIDCASEVVMYNGKPRRLMRDDHPFPEPVPVSKVISWSSNRGATRLAMMLGDQRFYDYARAFGIGEASGFPFGGEVNGILYRPEKWSGSDITRLPAGYSVAVTPLQIHYAMATIASGGELMRPQVIKEIRDARGETVYTFGGVARRRVVSQRTAEEMARMLMGVVTEGTGRIAALPGYEIAGKTGTAQKIIDGRYSNRDHVGSFVGFFPATRPRVVISVIVDDANLPNGRTASGSAVAAPSFKRVAEQLISYLDIKPVADLSQHRLALEGGRR
jgi:cell division protein FtsI (penicillin-binding protein 3)